MTTILKPAIFSRIESKRAGKRIAIMVGVHGNEKGPQFEWDWLKGIEIHSGSVDLIFANPTACDRNVRFVNTNLNRRFGLNENQYPEDSIARSIEKVLDDCDALLDLHMYNESMDRPFAICSPTSNEAAMVLSAKYIVNIPEGEYGGGSDDYMAMKGKVGVCFETGGVDRPHAYSDTIQGGVLSFLAHFGLVPKHSNTKSIHSPRIFVKDTTKLVEGPDITFSRDYTSFDAIKKGEVICTENGVDIVANSDGCILFPRPNNPIGTEAFYTLVRNS